MATTENGIYYPNDGTKAADVLADLELMAKSIDETIGKEVSNNKYDDTKIKQDISDIQKEQSTQNKNIENLQTNDNKQDELISKLKNALINAETEESKSIHVEDANKFGQLEILGNQEQETRSGKNKLKLEAKTTTSGGVTWNITEKDVSISGTTQETWVTNTTQFEIEPNTYKFVVETNNSNVSYRIWLRNAENELLANIANGQTVELSEKATQYVLVVEGLTAGQAYNITFNPMILLSTEDDESFEQYGASPSPNYPSKVKCLGSNKNIFDGVLELGNIDTSTGQNSEHFNIIRSKNYNELNGEKEVTVTGIPNFYFFTYTEDKAYIESTYENPITIPENARYFKLRTWNSDNITDINTKIKVEEGDKATSYSPYGQGSTKISKINKNLFDNEFETGRIDTDGTEIESSAAIYVRTKNYIRVFEGHTYTIVNGIKNKQQKGRLYDINKNCIGTSSSIVSNTDNLIKKYTPDEGVAFIRFELDFDDAETGQAVIDGEYPFAIYQDSDDTDYIEHQQEDYLLYIQQEMLEGDYFIKEADGWKEVHGWNKIILTGNENLIKSGASSSDKLIAALAISNGIDGFGYSNYFKYSETFGIGNFIVYNNGTNLAFGFDSTEIATLEEAKSFLTEKYNAGNPVYFYYKTATLTKLACTEEQSAVLEELNNMDLFEGVNNIITAEDVALLKLKYALDVKTYVNNQLANVNAQILNIAGGN